MVFSCSSLTISGGRLLSWLEARLSDWRLVSLTISGGRLLSWLLLRSSDWRASFAARSINCNSSSSVIGVHFVTLPRPITVGKIALTVRYPRNFDK
jgi:hypothetical protein